MITTLFVALGGLALAVLGAAVLDPQRTGMKSLLAVGAVAVALLALGALPAEAQSRTAAAGVRPVASYTAPVGGHGSTASAQSANRAVTGPSPVSDAGVHARIPPLPKRPHGNAAS